MKTFKTCGSCLYRSGDTGECPFLKIPVDTKNTACPRHVDEQKVATCELCGARLTRSGGTYFVGEDRPHFTCNSCGDKTGTCATCIKTKECLFLSDPSPLPKVVQEQIRQGNVVQIMSIKNPSRVAITCVHCDCYDKEYDICGKEQDGTCSNYTIVWN